MQQYHDFVNKACYKNRSRDLRNCSTTPEKMMWKMIRNKILGVKFRRQYNIGGYITDFYCHELKLIIEIDGSVHNIEEIKRNDLKREYILKNLGYTILRYSNDDVVVNPSFIIANLKKIIDTLQTRETPHL